MTFAKRDLLPNAAQWDQHKQFSVSTLRQAAELGFGGLFVPEEWGGCNVKRADAAVIFEALSYGDISHTTYLTIHNMVAGIIARCGSREQQQQWLPPLADMSVLASYCLTEPGSGSDAASLQTTARRTGSNYVLDGAKAFISGAGAAHLYLVMARTGQPGPKGITAFLVPKDTPGLEIGKPERKMGWNAQPTCAVSLDGVVVPESQRLGQEGQGFNIAMTALDGGRVNIAACSLGGAQLCLDIAQEYVTSRQQFGKPLGAFQNTQFKLADMATLVQASRLMVRNAAQSLDLQLPTDTMDAAMAKRFATDSCLKVADTSLQLLGGYGYLQDYTVERVLRDLRVHCILEGTNEIMRVIIHRELEKQ